MNQDLALRFIAGLAPAGMRRCKTCRGLFTGEPRRPLRNMFADILCGACDLRETQALFSNDWDWDDEADMVEWWRDLIETIEREALA